MFGGPLFLLPKRGAGEDLFGGAPEKLFEFFFS